MNILPQAFMVSLMEYLSEHSSARDILGSLLAPFTTNRSVMTYAGLVSGIDEIGRSISCHLMKSVLEKMDHNFFISENRSRNYESKHYRERTMITVFGEVVFKRHEYRDKRTRMPYIYVDEEIGLERRQRYDACVCAKAYELYSNQNSMIKVGQILGDSIGPFTLNGERKLRAIPRQTIFKMNNRFEVIKAPIGRADETPETLYIMADEKYIHLQRMMAKWRKEMEDAGMMAKEINSLAKTKRFSYMTKMAVAFSGREEMTDKHGKPRKRRRWKFTNKHIMVYPDDTANFWANVQDELNEIYDMSKVKRIYILGDGAEWIRSGVSELKTQNCIVSFAIDRFHMVKKIHTITKDPATRNMIYDYVRNGDHSNTKRMIDGLYKDKTISKLVQDCIDYVYKHMGAAVIMENEVKIGCAMEQAIQHILASNFTSVPKAYVNEHLYKYLYARVQQQNGTDMLWTYIAAMDRQHTDSENPNRIDLHKEDMSFDIFDTKASDPYYHANLSTVDHRSS